MELTEYLNSDSFKKFKNNKNKLIQHAIYYYILFPKEFNTVDDLLNRINDDNIDNNFATILYNKLLYNNANKKNIYLKILSNVGNIKYELVDDNDTDYFDKIIDILNSYNIKLNIRNKKLASNNIDKILECYNYLDSKIASIANLMNNKNDIFYNVKEYENIRNSFYKYLTKLGIEESTIIEIIYLLDSHYYNSSNRIIVTNNVVADELNLSEIIRKYKSEITSYLKELITNKKEKKVENPVLKASIRFNKELDDTFIINYLTIQEKLKEVLNNKINIAEEDKAFLSKSFNNYEESKSMKR
jgi:hypothetical protein